MEKASFLMIGLHLCAVAISMNTAFGYSVVELFRDDFEGVLLDTEKWGYRDVDSRVSGITVLKGCPQVSSGMLTIIHHTYNNDDPNYMRSQEIFTKQKFDPNQSLTFEARLRLRAPIGNGLVAGFYTYTDKPKSETDPNRINDEIDFEFLTNQINNPYPVILGDRVYVSIYNDFDGDWVGQIKYWNDNPNVPRVYTPGKMLNLTMFNTFQIRWLGDRVEWYWIPDDRSGPVIIYKTSNVLPDEPMSLYFNFWAANEYWPIAWDENLTPATRPEDDVVSFFDVDYVAVRSILPGNCNEVWDLGEGMATDYNKDCIVNLLDFSVFAEDWLKVQQFTN